MATLLPDVSFPLHGQGETAAVRDHLPLRLLSLSGCTIDRRWAGGGTSDMASPFWRLYLDLDAGAEIRWRGRGLALLPGHLYAVPAWLSWRGRCATPVRHGNALLDLPSLTREQVGADYPAPLLLAAPASPLAQGWAALLADLARVAQPTTELEARGHGLAWMAVAAILARARLGAQPVTPVRADHRFAQLLLWAESRLGEPLRRGDLAATAGCSEAELARRFARTLGTSPARWLRQRRIALAADLLRQTTRTVEDIAAACGLGDRAQFSKVFAAHVGSGPATWRKLQGA